MSYRAMEQKMPTEHMMQGRMLIDYLPVFVRSFDEIKRIMDAEQIAVEDTWNATEQVLRDQFVSDAGEQGIRHWEHILRLAPKATYTLEERRFFILAKLNEQLPYTLDSLRAALANLCGQDGFGLRLDAEHYELRIKLALENENHIEAVCNLLDKMVPANMVKTVMLFNTQVTLGEFTHAQLAGYTHKEVREEILG